MIRFSKYIRWYFIISALVLVPGVYSLIVHGLRPSVDFAGGTLAEFRFQSDPPGDLIESIAKKEGVTVSSVQKTSESTYLLRLPDEKQNIVKMQRGFVSASISAELLRNETVGPTLGAELLGKTITAAILAILAILAYVAYAFKNIKFGVSAVVALLHDLLVVLGIFSLLGHYLHIEVDTLFVTAFLTTMSFSVHDTIVVFDRIREKVRKGKHTTFAELSDEALTETIGRSLANSFTIIFMLLALILLGGATIRWFVVALLIGTISGTYSSPFVATPVLILWDRWERRRLKKAQ